MDWLRLYGEFATDPKVQSMSEAMQRRLVMLFCLRCSNTLETLQDDEIAFALRITEAELAETKELFVRKRFINVVDDTWQILAWDTRQYVSDKSAPRVAKHRAKKAALLAAQETGDVTAGNVTVSPQKQKQKQNRTEAEDGAELPAPGAQVEPSTAVDLSIAMRKAGVQAQPAHPLLIKLAADGVSPATVTAACAEARKTKPAPARIPPGFVISILKRWALEAQALKVAGAAIPQARASPAYGAAREQSRMTAAASIGLGGGSGPEHHIIDINARPGIVTAVD